MISIYELVDAISEEQVSKLDKNIVYILKQIVVEGQRLARMETRFNICKSAYKNNSDNLQSVLKANLVDEYKSIVSL